MSLLKTEKIYMIGIKGVGMTMLAQFFVAQGIEVSGSDTTEKFMTDKVLKQAGIKVIENFNKDNIPKDVKLIIYSSAYSVETNSEVAEALNRKVKVLTYAEAMGEIFNQKYGIAVVGSHGKTTTTAWLGYIMQKSGLNPNVMVGASVPQFSGAALIAKSDYLVIEADEYQNKLKSFQPKAVILNNIDYDHPDFFPSEEDYKNVFIEFIKKIPVKGFLVANFDDLIVRGIARVNCRGQVITYAINEVADYIAYDIKQAGDKQYFKVKFGAGDDDGGETTRSPLRQPADRNDGALLGDFCIQLLGLHNISNALAVIAAGIELGVELVDIRKYLEEFKGTDRRMQVLGKFRGAVIIDDYAHHPTEIKTTLAGAREFYKDKNLIVVFHPHTFTRTKALLDNFASSFSDADEVIVLDIYGSAREEHGGVHSKDLVYKIKKQKNKKTKKQFVKYIASQDRCEEYLRDNIGRGDIVILMGAGDVFRIGENLIQ